MADDSSRFESDDESKIVTKFLLNTCRLRQPTKRHVDAAGFCVGLAAVHLDDDDEADSIPLTTGSVVEFYIQPVLSCVGDIDTMFHQSTHLALPAGYPTPSQLPAEFHSRVKVYEIIDSEYPGYVYLLLSYLLTENIDDDKYDAVQCDRLYMMHEFSSTRDLGIHGPAVTVIHPQGGHYDMVRCMRSLYWPTQAADWPKRHRNYGWPDSATVDHVVSNGCDVVGVAHRLCKQDEWMNTHQCRLSFSRAEIVLLNSWMPVQQIVYHMLRIFVKTERLTDITDSTGTKILSNYNIKTLILWACELKPRSWWTDGLNVVRTCVVLLHTLADWLRDGDCPQYFVNNCNLLGTFLDVEIVIGHLQSITESWLSKWFVNNYLRKCSQLCPDRVSRLFDDVSTSMKLQNAVSAVVDWRLNTALKDLRDVWGTAEYYICRALQRKPLTLRSYDYFIDHFTNINSCLHDYISAVTFLHVAYKAPTHGLSDELIDVLTTTCVQFIGKRRYCHKLNSVLSLSQAAKLMKVVVNTSRSTVQLIEIELSKAHLYRALRCKDSDSDSIYCLTNVYLAVLYYTTGHYQKAIDHCTLVMRSLDHSQCSSHVVQGELLPKIDDDIDNVLGLAVFYQYVRSAALNQQQQTQHVSVFTTELLAHCLHIRGLSATNCCHLGDEAKKMFTSIVQREQPYISDVLCSKLMNADDQKCHHKPLAVGRRQHLEPNLNELDTSELVELLQQSAVEHLTAYRQLQAQKFRSVATIVTTDFEALYAYKRGDYQQCLLLSTQNVRMLLYADNMTCVYTFPEFIQLMDDDIVSLTALHLVINPGCRDGTLSCVITQLTLSLYLMTQCQLKLHHSVTSLSQTLYYIKVAQRRHPVQWTLNHLTLKLTERKAIYRPLCNVDMPIYIHA